MSWLQTTRVDSNLLDNYYKIFISNDEILMSNLIGDIFLFEKIKEREWTFDFTIFIKY